MNSLLENNLVSEVACGSNFSYVINDNNIFMSTEYKVLQSQMNNCFVKCMKMLYNGKIQLYYLTDNLRPLSSLIPTLDSENLLTVVTNLFTKIIDVKNNGFLSCQNIDISFEHIYVDPATYKVRLIYLPLNKRLYSDYPSFENEIRSGFVKLISGISSLSSPKTMQLASDLSNGTLSLEDIKHRIKGGKVSTVAHNVMPSAVKSSGAGAMRIVAMNAPSRVEIEITNDNFVIGKKAGLCDGVISYNKMISRAHCKINIFNNQYAITDLGSANGTFVNGARLQPNQAYQIKNGDILRLANSDFQVVIG